MAPKTPGKSQNSDRSCLVRARGQCACALPPPLPIKTFPSVYEAPCFIEMREVEASWLIHGFPKEFQANEKLACRKQNVHSLSLLPYSRPIRSLLLLFWQPQILPYLQLRGLECDGTVGWSGVDVDCFHGSWLVTVSVVKDK